MITVPGKINIRTISGRFGDFNVGTLECSIGSFSVKDPAIDEFSEGVYTGSFVIESIKPDSYVASGRMVVEVRARLKGIMLDDELSLPSEPESYEQDPLEQECQSVKDVQAPAASAKVDSKAETSNLTPAADENDGGCLFGVLWPLGSVVRLDSTIERLRLRQQKKFLQDNGYSFRVAQQHWVKD
ncbi:DUF3275 family protein [Marinagarivorans cellulosilyticus]|uniref:DUF3275 family protein n=1 Tax=Marinagarivorans cellulosilyticus TaxID=2721545 RepID=A0AAN1WHJ3_9GAMM|nr:DUF3275 family protein [Marinagarivorans cellulosilyticus]BCD97679.1 hypothetical protein MARGE09_P1880 [Marinagarivorans cellulosilyticus]